MASHVNKKQQQPEEQERIGQQHISIILNLSTLLAPTPKQTPSPKCERTCILDYKPCALLSLINHNQSINVIQ
jgi:hypothetical protein